MIRKINILTLLLALATQFGYSQIDHNKAHRRYWYYRARLINDFMKIGKLQGDCIVFPQRNYGNTSQSKVGPDQIDIINMYLMTLSLEYKLLSRANQDVSETIYEIYHILYTINRLDLEAELFWDTPVPTSELITPGTNLNGFYLREDMYTSYIGQNINHYNYELNLGNGTNKGFTGLPFTDHIEPNENKFSRYFKTPTTVIKNDLIWPHDKYHSLLTALMFIVKYIPDNVTYNNEAFQDNETKIKQEAKNIADRAYTYLHGHSGAWDLKYRNTANIDLGSIAVGNVASIYSYPLSRMACNVHFGFPFNQSEVSCSNNSYYDALASSFGKLTYNTFVTSAGATEDDAVFRAWDAAGANISPSSGFLGGGYIPIFQAMQVNTAQWKLEWAELMRKVLHQDGALLRQSSVFYNPIGSAPCYGPYNFSDNNGCTYGDAEWSSQDRLEHPTYIQAGCPWTSNSVVFRGYYPGVDYMLLHNLYYEYQNQLGAGNNGNVGNTLNTAFGNVITYVYNASTNLGNAIGTTLCNIASSFVNGITGGSIPCGNSNSGNSGSGSTAPVNSYLAYNLMDNIDENIWPRVLSSNPNNTNSNLVQGTNVLPAKVSVFQYLKSKSHIYSSISPAAPNNQIQSNVVYRAGKEITLVDGFTVELGSNFHAYIARYLCSNNNDPLTMRTTGDSTNTDSINTNYETDVYNLVPIHFVEHEKSDSDIYPVINDSTGESSRQSIEHKSLTDYYSESEIQKMKENGIIPHESVFYKSKIMPNPNDGSFKIALNKKLYTVGCVIEIFDAVGELIQKNEGVYEDIKYNLASFPSGIYQIKVTSMNSNEIELLRLIKL